MRHLGPLKTYIYVRNVVTSRVSISELIKYEAIGESEACEDCSAELLRRFEDSANSETCEGLDSVPSPKKQTNKLNTKQPVKQN